MRRCRTVGSLVTSLSSQPAQSRSRLALVSCNTLKHADRATRSSHRAFVAPQKPLEASLSATALALAFIVSVTATITYDHIVDYAAYTEGEQDTSDAENWAASAEDGAPRKDIPNIAPDGSYYSHMAQYETKQGWPGNLTDEQDAKLRQLWLQLGNIVGITDGRASIDRSDSIDGSPSPSTAGDAPHGKKKSRLSFLKGKSDKNSTSNDATANDKYGQKDEYLQAISEQSPDEMRRTIWSFMKADEPDALLCRFLRARKWDVNKALVMLISTVRWRGKTTHLDDEIIYRGEEHFAQIGAKGTGRDKDLGQGFMHQWRAGKAYVHGVDKMGRPISIVRVKLHKAGDQINEALETFTIFNIETTRMMLRPPVDTALVVFDMTGFGMANMDYAPLKFMIKCFEANYPECLGAVCIHRAPWIFNSIWNVVKGWLDPVVASKINFTKDVNDLAQFIDREKIPKVLGGEEDWDFDYIEPVAGENRIMEDKDARKKIEDTQWTYVEEYEKATLEWIASDGKDEKAIEKRHDLFEKMRQNYWKLDPYVRARTYYDRVGVLQPGGIYKPYATSRPGSELANGISTDQKPKSNGSIASAGQEEGKSSRTLAPAMNRLSMVSQASADDVFYDAPETPSGR